VPREWAGQSLMLNFEAVDYSATVYINGKEVGQHRGGYDRFALDISNFTRVGETNEL
jgi:beta-galactosidase/beta-glucuronidase